MLTPNTSFKQASHIALQDTKLQKALSQLKKGAVVKRAAAIAQFPAFNDSRQHAQAIKDHTLSHLAHYLCEFESRVIDAGGTVHWASDASDACTVVFDIIKKHNATHIAKSKSMVSEEIGLNHALAAKGLHVVETDLGEYIIQLRQETPSHIVTPAIHISKEEVASTFYEHHQQQDKTRSLETPAELLTEAREILRQKFLNCTIGITGANFLVAENGNIVLVTNEGNADLIQAHANVHIVLVGIEKVVPRMEDALTLLRLLTRSATGQPITSYVTFVNGIQPSENEGPKEYHVILVDNGRSELLNTEFQAMLRCIRCGACLNHCPVYEAIGGQAYGAVYPGPMGAVLSPSLFGFKPMADLPNASTFCGRCEQVCPLNIPLPQMMRDYRKQQYQQKISPKAERAGLRVWALLATHPVLYHFVTSWVARILGFLGKRTGRFTELPFAKGWTQFRDFPAPARATFQQQWRKKNRN